MDLSIEAIEADLSRAEQTLGRPESAIHMQRAQVRATLLAAQVVDLTKAEQQDELPAPTANWVTITTPSGTRGFALPDDMSDRDRLEMAAGVLNLEPDDLATRADSESARPLWNPDRPWHERIWMAAEVLGMTRDEVRSAIDPTVNEEPLLAAARILGLVPDDLAARLSPTAGTVPELADDQRSQYADEDIDEDFFAEARKEHKGKRQ
jgi:hypothetical protein